MGVTAAVAAPSRGRRQNNRKVEEATRRQMARGGREPEGEGCLLSVIVQRAEKNVYGCVCVCATLSSLCCNNKFFGAH